MNIRTNFTHKIIHLPLCSLMFALVMALQPSNAQAQTPTTQPSTGSGGRQPLITNVFGTTTGGALQNRRPGLEIQQAIAIHNGDDSSFDGNVTEEPPTFIEDTVQQMLLAVFDGFTQILDGIGFLISGTGGDLTGVLNGLPNLGGIGSGFPSLTDGNTGSVPIQ